MSDMDDGDVSTLGELHKSGRCGVNCPVKGCKRAKRPKCEELPPQTREPVDPPPAKYFEDSEDGYRKLAEFLLGDPVGYYTLGISDSMIAFRFGAWTATHKTVPDAWTDMRKKPTSYVEILARRPGGFAFAFGPELRRRVIIPMLTMRDPFPGRPR